MKDAETPTSAHTPVMLHSQAELEHWLTKNQIDFSGWGGQSTKTIEQLWHEIEAGEVYLQAQPPGRVCSVIKVFIRRVDKLLVETEQLFLNGQRRARNHPPAEKIKFGEAPLEAAKRCLQEELELQPQDFALCDRSYQKSEEWKSSPSFPGLMTRYIVHAIEAEVPGLPETGFRTHELSDTNSPVKTHYWDWRAQA